MHGDEAMASHLRQTPFKAVAVTHQENPWRENSPQEMQLEELLWLPTFHNSRKIKAIHCTRKCVIARQQLEAKGLHCIRN